MKFITILLSVCVLFLAACTPTQQVSVVDSSKYFDARVAKALGSKEKGWIPLKRNLTAMDFGAIPNDGKDDTQALQKAFDYGDVIIDKGKYNVSQTLYITKHGSFIQGQKGVQIIYSGSKSAISSKKINKTFPVSCQLSQIRIKLTKPDQVGFNIKLSYSQITNCSVNLSKSGNVGFQISGDSNGTGSYYNNFSNCNVQGNAFSGSKNQIGIEFCFDKSFPSRCPNANVFFGGRIGQVSQGIVIRGTGNNFYSPALEGVIEKCIVFNHPTAKYGCISNNVYSPYIEGNKGATAAYFDNNALNCQVLNPFITSLGTDGKMIEDNSTKQSNGLVVSSDISRTFSKNKNGKLKSQNRETSSSMMRFGKNKPTENAPNGTLYSRTVGGGELYFRKNGAWVKIK